jgi:hypothetical protein
MRKAEPPTKPGVLFIRRMDACRWAGPGPIDLLLRGGREQLIAQSLRVSSGIFCLIGPLFAAQNQRKSARRVRPVWMG